MRALLITVLLITSDAALANESPEALQAAFMSAMRAQDVEGLAACYTDDATNFPVDALIGTGPDSVRASWGGFFATYRVIAADLSEEHLETIGDTAVAWGLFTLQVEPVDGGETIEMIGRYMDVAKNIDGNWLYVADHASVPVPGD